MGIATVVPNEHGDFEVQVDGKCVKDGVIDTERVFTNETDAKSHALKKLAQEEDVLLQKLENLRCTKNKLQG
jgi:hypothetical protein